ncbi:MAG: hypothetical protein IJZ96_01795 [Lachnospiraceae bacterium]|nr:hypothetical protein [Lachnospiraceae bacterium]
MTEIIFILSIVFMTIGIVVSILPLPDPKEDKCKKCEHGVLLDGEYVCSYHVNRDVDAEGFYIDELPCERGNE